VNTVYVALNDWQRGNYKPYVVKSADRGRTWTNITGDLPAKHDVWALAPDHVNDNLIFAGTEFGLFFTVDGGTHWVQLKGGMPITQVRDVTIQKRENDVVMATFGRGFWVLDDFSALREINPQTLNEEARLFPLRHAYSFTPGGVMQAGANGIGALSGNWTTPNPPVGAWITYNVKAAYPAETKLVLTITDANNNQVRRCELDKTAGLRRFVWGLNGDPAPVDTSAAGRAGAGRGGRGGAGGGAAGRGGAGGGAAGRGGAAGAGAPPAAGGAGAPPPNGGITACAPAAGGAGGFGGGGGGGRGGPGGGRVNPGVYHASIGKMVGTTVTPIGPSQTFQVIALPAAPPQ
jgi:hypothetical protein